MTNNVRKLLFPTEEEMNTQYKEMQEAVGECCKRGLSELQEKIMHEVDMSDRARFLRGEFNKPSEAYDQTAKADKGKPMISLVPTDAIIGIARIREYGCKKYPKGGKDNWKQVEADRYIDAMLRHALAFKDDPYGVDEESGLPHLWHCGCNYAFLAELLSDRFEEYK